MYDMADLALPKISEKPRAEDPPQTLRRSLGLLL
jgi:hypothetical protein